MATETHGAEESASGLPQLDFSTFPNQIFWLVIALIAIYLILSRVSLPRIASVLAERQGAITNDIAAAEELKQEAAEAEAAYEKALADARAEAGRISAEAKAEMQAEVDAAMKKADAEIAARTAESEARISEIRDGAAAAVKEVAKDTAEAVVAALGIDVDRGALDAAVDAKPTFSLSSRLPCVFLFFASFSWSSSSLPPSSFATPLPGLSLSLQLPPPPRPNAVSLSFCYSFLQRGRINIIRL